METKPNIRKCDFCHCQEGEMRPVGDYEIILKPIVVSGTTKLACQSCYRYTRRNTEMETIKKSRVMNILKKIKHLGLKLFAFALIMPVFSAELFAQGVPGLPGFPDTPSAAPIDGGLSLLAVAGGAYALKKLKKRKNTEEIE